MAMVVVDDRRTHSPSQVAWSEGRRLFAVLHLSDEPSELSQWPCGHDDSTINIILGLLLLFFFTLGIYSWENLLLLLLLFKY